MAEINQVVAVIGAGTMGCGIAQVAAVAGNDVLLCDTAPAALLKGRQRIESSLAESVSRGRLSTEAAAAALARVRGVASIRSLPAGETQHIDLLIEAVAEDLEIKATLLGDFESLLRPDAIIATNTSSLSVTALAARLQHPERVAGFHFFNPVPALPLVEVVQGTATSAEVVTALVQTARAWGKIPVVCRSTPGFIVNRVARPFYGETLRLLQERAADPATLDAVMRESGGFKMGACELMDLIGHDVNFAVTRSVWQALYLDPRYQPSPLQQALVDAGWFGKKSGRGFYDHRPSAPAAAPQSVRHDPGAAPPTSIVVEGDLGAAEGLASTLQAQWPDRVERRPGRGLLRVDGLTLALTDGRTAAERSLAEGEPVVVFDLALDYANCRRIAIAVPSHAGEAALTQAAAVFQHLGKTVTLLEDVPGLLVMRTLAMLANEAADAVHQGVASAEDVDLAMCKGVNYPRGPLAWAQAVGHGTLLAVLTRLHDWSPDGRYRASPGLRHAVLDARLREGALL